MDAQTIKVQQEEFFYQRTDTFDLSVSLVDKKKLIVTIKDFMDWIIYSKQYTEEDQRKEIHKKMELIDVYTAFAQTKSQCDEETMRAKQNQGDQLKKYEFGSIVMNEEEPCYKINRGGQITVYLSIHNKKTKKDVTYESKLILNKVRDMSETEISAERSTLEKNQGLERLKEELRQEKKENEKLAKRIIRLEEELKITKQKLDAKNAEQQQKLNSTKENLETNFNTTKKELVASNQHLKQELYSTKLRLDQTQYELQAVKNELNSTKLGFHQRISMVESIVLMKEESI